MMGGATAVPAEADAVGEQYSTWKQRAYAVAVLLTTLLLVWLIVVEGVDTSYWGIAYPVLATYGAALFAVLWWRQFPLRTVESLVLGPLVGVVLGFLAAWRIAPEVFAIEAANLFLVMLWVGPAFPLFFLLFTTRRALQVSLGVYGVFLALVLPPALGGAAPSYAAGSLSRSTISLAVFFAVLIALLWVLASRLEDLASARAEAKLFAAQAVTDTLTGLANRRQLDDELERQIASAHRYGQPLSITLVDVDSFKTINDRLGHQVGDRVLIEVAQQLTGSVRTSDLLGRWGGEEFLLISPHTDHHAARVLAERCRARVADATFAEEVHVTASFGVAALAAEDDARTLVRRADHALYPAKNQGRDRVETVVDVPDPPMDPGPG